MDVPNKKRSAIWAAISSDFLFSAAWMPWVRVTWATSWAMTWARWFSLSKREINPSVKYMEPLGRAKAFTKESLRMKKRTSSVWDGGVTRLPMD